MTKKKKSENPFRIIYTRVYNYFTYSVVRRIFFFALATVLISAIFVQIFGPHTFLLGVLLIAAAVAAFATMVDSVQAKRAFVSQLRDIESDSVMRAYENEGEEAVSKMQGLFSQMELKFMRKKKREYNYTIFVKFLFVVIFVVLFVNLF